MISVSFNLFYQGFLRVRQNYFKGSQGVLLKIFKRLQSFLAVMQNTAIRLFCIDEKLKTQRCFTDFQESTSVSCICSPINGPHCGVFFTAYTSGSQGEQAPVRQSPLAGAAYPLSDHLAHIYFKRNTIRHSHNQTK